MHYQTHVSLYIQCKKLSYLPFLKVILKKSKQKGRKGRREGERKREKGKKRQRRGGEKRRLTSEYNFRL